MTYKLRELLSKQKTIACDHVVSWESMLRSHIDPVRESRRQAADRVAHAIAGDILQGGNWSVLKEPHGTVFRVRGHWLTYEQLYSLLEEAHSLGRLHERNIRIAEGGLL